MKSYLQRKLSELDERLPVRKVALLPGDLFYNHSFDVPEGTPEEAVADFAQLQLETRSPFPVEGLAWGFLYESHQQVFAYAATHERLERVGYEQLGDYWFALPGFVALCGETAPGDVVRFCLTERTLSALFFNEGERAPRKVVSRVIGEDVDLETPSALLEARDSMIPQLGKERPTTEEGLWQTLGAEAPADGRLCFRVRRITPDEAKDLVVESHMGQTERWNADIRGRIFAHARRKERRTARQVWLGFQIAGGAFALLVLAQLILFALGLATHFMQNRADARDDAVALLQSKQDFANNLESVTDRELKPFSMLALANSLRPQELYFEQVSAEAWNVLRIEGQAQRTEQLASYVDALRNSPQIRDVRDVRSRVQAGASTSFSLEVEFNQLEDLTPVSDPESTAADEAANSEEGA